MRVPVRVRVPGRVKDKVEDQAVVVGNPAAPASAREP